LVGGTLGVGHAKPVLPTWYEGKIDTQPIEVDWLNSILYIYSSRSMSVLEPVQTAENLVHATTFCR
jgi:hypothetical protein